MKKQIEQEEPRQVGAHRNKVLTVFGIILCVILVPILILNVTLIIKSYTNKEQVPSIGGYLPLIVLTDSMAPNIQGGDLIICHTADPAEVQVGDIISFFDPEGNGTSIVTHRVTAVFTENGVLRFRTKGDANQIEDRLTVAADKLVGVYRTRLAGVGNIAMFMQTTPGLIVCVILPLALLIGYDLIRRRLYEKSKQQDTNALLAELEALKAEKAASMQAESTEPTEQSPDASDRTPDDSDPLA